MRDAFVQLIRTPPEQRDAAAVARSAEASARVATLLDAHLAARRFVAGDAFTAGDVAVGAHAHRWLNLPIARPSLAHLEGWYARLKARPGAQGVLTLPVT